jgi:MYXO-CTERM domain-containing protein
MFQRASRSLVFAVCASVLALGACELEHPDTGSSAVHILGGTQSQPGQFPSVVAIVVDQGRRGMCTGTLVAPDVVLTAAHCIAPNILRYQSQSQVTANTIVAYNTVNLLNGNFQAATVRDTIPHPFSRPGDPDVGLVLLNQPITGVTPTPLNLLAADAPIGVRVTMVGFGVSDTTNGGVSFYIEEKASTSCAPYQVSNDMFLCFSQTDGQGKCSGDSGGPSFATIGGRQKVIGITSFGDQNCQYFGADMRVDASLDFIAQHAPQLVCGDDGVCNESCGTGGLPDDPDCNFCEVDDDCDDPTNEYCNNQGQCETRPLSPGGVGSECTDNSDCDSGMCAAGPDGMRCVSSCDPDDLSACPDQFDCLPAGDGGACWPSDDALGGGCGCAATPSGGDAAGMLLLALGVFALWRRRLFAAPR